MRNQRRGPDHIGHRPGGYLITKHASTVGAATTPGRRASPVAHSQPGEANSRDQGSHQTTFDATPKRKSSRSGNWQTSRPNRCNVLIVLLLLRTLIDTPWLHHR